MHGKSIAYFLRVSKKARCLRISISRDGAVTVTIPRMIPAKTARDFVLAKFSWIVKSLEYFKNHQSLVPPRPRGDYKKHQAPAKNFVLDKVRHWNKIYNFRFNKISIRNSKTRWGSCSKKGNLNFNYKVLFLPPEQADYLVVHELCHLKEFNHSKNFWLLVGQTIPDYKKLRKSLRQNLF